MEKNYVLEINDIYKSYGDLDVLKGISLSVKKGEVVVILGPSGCGKSTLLRCINGLEKFQKGEILFDGQVIQDTEASWNELRKKVGMVFQSYDLFPHMKVIDNVLLGPMKAQHRKKEEVYEQAMNLLDRVNLADKEKVYPSKLSGGQKQRVAIVRSLCMNPEIMLFDEVTAALDPEMVYEVLEVMLQLAKQGLTMLIVTHEIEFAKAIADRVIFLIDGKIAEEGEGKSFFNAPKTERAKQFLNKFKFIE